MDLSEEYRKMCMEAEEIQKETPEKGSIYYSEEYQSPLIYGYSGFRYAQHYHNNIFKGKFWQVDEGHTTFYFTNKPIFIPRQDQLQEMLLDEIKEQHPEYMDEGLGYMADFYHWWTTGETFYNNIRSEISQSWFPPKSMEQLLLAYLMIIKFNKTWDGKEWQS